MDQDINSSISKLERENALKQLTDYDTFMGGVNATEDTALHYTVVVIPSGENRTEEKWVGISPYTSKVKEVRQPDEGREALVGYTDCGGYLCYYYTDELPCCLAFLTILAVVLSCLATPLTLLCLVPIIRQVNQARKKVKEKNLPLARQICRSACQWKCLYLIIWVTAATPVVALLYLVPIVVLSIFYA